MTTKNKILVNEDDMGEVSDIVIEIEAAIDDLRIAECVETQADLIGNLKNALDNLDIARQSIEALLKTAQSRR